MDRHGSDNTWAPEKVALQEAPGSKATGPSSETAATGTTVSPPEVLARLPDLDAVDPSGESAAKPGGSDGRILSQGLSTKLLVGGGVLLVLAAIFPFVFGGNDEPKPGTPIAPDAPEAPTWNGQAAETLDALPASAGVSYEPEMTFNPELPPPPDFIGTAPESPGPGPSPETLPADRPDRVGAPGDQLQAPPAEQQSRIEAGRPQARANQMMTIGNLTPTPAGIYADVYRRDHQADSRANLPARYPTYSTSYQAVEPGVARLEGIIEKPSVRTSYDAARSSVH